MSNILINLAISTLLAFIESTIKNPTSAKAVGLADKLALLRDSLNVLLVKLGR